MTKTQNFRPRAALSATIGLLLALGLGIAGGRWLWPAVPATATVAEDAREILYWRAPMDPNYRRDQPGKSPMGMDLVPVYSDEAGPEGTGVVVIHPAIINSLGVRTAPAQRGRLSRIIDTVGYVSYDEDTLHHVHTRVEGWVEDLAVRTTGEAVRKGQVLFELYSPVLVNAEEEFLAAYQSGNSALLDASEKRLLALGITESKVQRLTETLVAEDRVQIFAERDGVVAHLGIREGIYVTPSTNIMSVAQLDRVWVLAEVFERQAAWVRAGQHAEVEFDYLPGERWPGTVDYVYPELDPQTRTLKVRLRFDNADKALRPNMFARVTIAALQTPPVVHVPREALIRGGSVNRVVLALGEGRFRSQAVTVGLESGDRVGIRRGLEEGDRVVISGQFLIDSESNIDSALSRLESRG